VNIIGKEVYAEIVGVLVYVIIIKLKVIDRNRVRVRVRTPEEVTVNLRRFHHMEMSHVLRLLDIAKVMASQIFCNTFLFTISTNVITRT